LLQRRLSLVSGSSTTGITAYGRSTSRRVPFETRPDTRNWRPLIGSTLSIKCGWIQSGVWEIASTRIGVDESTVIYTTSDMDGALVVLRARTGRNWACGAYKIEFWGQGQNFCTGFVLWTGPHCWAIRLVLVDEWACFSPFWAASSQYNCHPQPRGEVIPSGH
jgi:hypothetical protein